MNLRKEDILERIENNEKIKFVDLLFPDILGTLKGFSIPSSEVERAFEEGKGFDGSSIEGMVRIEESDLVAKPDPKTYREFPWDYKDKGDDYRIGLMFCDIYDTDGNPSKGDTRYVLKKNLEKAKEKGFDSFKVGPELEFFYFPDNKEIKPLEEGGYFSMGAHDKYASLRKKTMLNLEEMGMDSELDHHEVASSQHEVDLKYKDALEMADISMLFRFIAKETARNEGIRATFMPKPMNKENGSGMHVHQSLWNGDENLFFDEDDEYYLSKTAKNYAAGLMENINEITSVLNQWTNSYKRLVPGYEAPVYHTWGQRNRSALIRVPEYQSGRPEARRIELRSPDPACNPYLAFSVMLAAGLDGIEREYQLPPPTEKNVYQNKEGLKTLPKDLEEALEITKNSDLVKEALGNHVFDRFIENKEKEIKMYRRTVTQLDLDYCLPRM